MEEDRIAILGCYSLNIQSRRFLPTWKSARERKSLRLTLGRTQNKRQGKDYRGQNESDRRRICPCLIFTQEILQELRCDRRFLDPDARFVILLGCCVMQRHTGGSPSLSGSQVARSRLQSRLCGIISHWRLLRK